MILDIQKVIDATEINKDPYKQVEWVAQYIYDNDLMFAATVRDSCATVNMCKFNLDFTQIMMVKDIFEKSGFVVESTENGWTLNISLPKTNEK